MKTVILDNGHGGVIAGKYQTAGKRSPLWADGRQLLEGVYNRQVVAKLKQLCLFHGIKCHVLVPEQEDITLGQRVKRANKIYAEDKDAFLLSIHADAFNKPQAHGFSFYTSVGQTKSDAIASKMIPEYQKSLPELKLRKDTRDGDLDKEAHFYILKHTHCPAVLIETGFMTNPEESKMMLDNPNQFANAIMKGILKVVDVEVEEEKHECNCEYCDR